MLHNTIKVTNMTNETVYIYPQSIFSIVVHSGDKVLLEYAVGETIMSLNVKESISEIETLMTETHVISTKTSQKESIAYRIEEQEAFREAQKRWAKEDKVHSPLKLV